MAWLDLVKLPQAAAISAMGQDVIYTPVGGAPVTLKAIFRKAHVALDVDSGAPMHSDQPEAHLRLSDLPGGAAARGDKLTQGGITYDVTEVLRDGEGMVTLRLMKKV